MAELRVKRFFAGEYTRNYSRTTGPVPNYECGHNHRTRRGADRCAAKHDPWITYAELSDGVITKADYLQDIGIETDYLGEPIKPV